MNQRIIKFCKKEHNVFNGGKLLIGNLEKYRSIENDELVDGGEGTFEFQIEFLDGAVISAEWANLIFQGLIGFGDTGKSVRLPGHVSAHVEELNINHVLGDKVDFKYARAKIQYTYPNAFLFCASMAQNESKEENPFEQYDDSWVVGSDQNTLNAFSARIGRLIIEQALGRHIARSTENLSFAMLKDLGVQIRHGPVQYVDRLLKITEETDQNFDNLIQQYLDVPFCKTKDYQNEKEYRFMFVPTAVDRLLTVENLDLFLEMHTLKRP